MSRVELIAECSTNHGGDLSLAKAFIDHLADAGADWIKFQYTRVQHLRPDDPQYAWFQQAELSDDQFAELKAHTEAAGAKFLLTVYNHQDVPAVRKLCDVVKIGSGEAWDFDLMKECQAAGFRVIRSEYKQPWRGIKSDWGFENLVCVTRYPASMRSCERAIQQIDRSNYVGYSDHSIGTEMATWAMECGARIIEKHVQLDHQARPPRPFEATVSEFKYLRTFADDDPEVKFSGRWQYA